MPLFDRLESAIPFCGARLDRADDKRHDSAWFAAQLASPAARFILLIDLKPVMRLDEKPMPLYLRAAELPGGLEARALLLGLEEDGAPLFAVDLSEAEGSERLLPEGAMALEARAVAMQLAAAEDAAVLAPLGQARSMAAWHRRRAFCSACGHRTASARAGYMRLCENPACRAEHFPRTDPVAIMLAIHGDRCLMGRNARFPSASYSALAGFMEPGESIEEAVRRETKEEAGIEIGRVAYVASQPWPFPSSLMIGCLAEALNEDIHIDPHEIEHARWFSREEVRLALAGDPAASFRAPPSIAIARHLLTYWMEKG